VPKKGLHTAGVSRCDGNDCRPARGGYSALPLHQPRLRQKPRWIRAGSRANIRSQPVLSRAKDQPGRTRSQHSLLLMHIRQEERVDGVEGDFQIMLLKVMHQPFSVYMAFQSPYPGREVVYVDGQNDGKLTVLDAGFHAHVRQD